MQLESKYQEELSHQKSQHRQLMEHHTAEQLSLKEALRKELAQVHMEKFSAMAAELSNVHKVKNAPIRQLCLDLTPPTVHIDKLSV